VICLCYLVSFVFFDFRLVFDDITIIDVQRHAYSIQDDESDRFFSSELSHRVWGNARFDSEFHLHIFLSILSSTKKGRPIEARASRLSPIQSFS
jgi:hypothetical protein